jgi:hypothetical protein
MKHVPDKQFTAFDCELLIDGFDFLEYEDALLGSLLLEVEQEEFVLGEGEEFEG